MATESPGSSRLVILPNELLVLIFQYLPPVDLARICRTSKTFLILTEPLLYAEIEIESDIIIPFAFYQLVRTMTTRPSLGLYVRRLELVLRRPDDRLTNKNQNIQNDAHWKVLDLAQIIVYLSTLPYFKPLSIWKEALAEREIELLSTILLHHIPNARMIRMDEAYMEGTAHLRSLVSLGGLEFPHLSNH
ncbi:hypothetical protein BDV12DRAFT_197277 [Aspergillus spectabilis]